MSGHSGCIRASVLVATVGLLVGCANSRPTAAATKTADATSTLASTPKSNDSQAIISVASSSSTVVVASTSSPFDESDVRFDPPLVVTTGSVPLLTKRFIAFPTGLLGYPAKLYFDEVANCLYMIVGTEFSNFRATPVFSPEARFDVDLMQVVRPDGSKIAQVGSASRHVDGSQLNGGRYPGDVDLTLAAACGGTGAHWFG